MTGSRLMLTLMIVIVAAACVVKAEEQPPWMIGVYVDYSATSEYVPSAGRYIDSFKTNTDAGTPGFGLSATRMLNDWIGVGGEIMGQVYHWKSHTYGFDIGPIYWPKSAASAEYDEGPSGTDFRFNFLLRALFISKPSSATHMAFLLGLGAYGYSRGELGFHGGILIRRVLPNRNAVFFGSRVHLIPMPSQFGALVQLTAGIDFRVKSKQR